MSVRQLLIYGIAAAPVLAYPAVTITDLAEGVAIRASQESRMLVPGDVMPVKFDPEQQEKLQRRLEELADKSLPVIQICLVPDNWEFKDKCKPLPTRPYPLLPIQDEARNKLLGRPPPEVVRLNIEQATEGRLSTVDALVARVIAHLPNLNALPDNELAALASNLQSGNSGWGREAGCLSSDYGPWDQDFLVSEDEQRAITAAFLYVLRDHGYQERRADAMREQIWLYGQEVRQKEFEEEKMRLVSIQLDRFDARMTDLKDEVSISDGEWLSRYSEHVDSLRAGLQAILDRFMRKDNQHSALSSMENLIDEAEVGADQTVCRHLPPEEEAGFGNFVATQREEIELKFPGIRRSHLERFAYRRWIALTEEMKTQYLASDKLDEGDETLEL